MSGTFTKWLLATLSSGIVQVINFAMTYLTGTAPGTSSSQSSLMPVTVWPIGTSMVLGLIDRYLPWLSNVSWLPLAMVVSFLISWAFLGLAVMGLLSFLKTIAVIVILGVGLALFLFFVFGLKIPLPTITTPPTS